MINIVQSIFEILIFISAVVLAFYFPGKYLTRKLKLKSTFLEDIFFNISLGLVIFTLIAYILSWIKISFLLLPILLFIAYFILKENFKLPNLASKEKLNLSLLLLMTLIFSLIMITSGQFGNTLRFVGANSFDGLWHVSLINELKYHFPPDNPGFAGVSLVGYHFFFNFVAAKLGSTFNISTLSLYFHFFPFLIAFLWTIGVYVLMFRWSGSRSVSLWAVFLTIFGGSFSFILRLQGHPGSLDDAFGMTQPYSSLLNPPFAISIILIIAILFSLLGYFKTRKTTWLIPVILFAGVITMFKVYAGIIILGSLGIMTLIQLFKRNYFFLLIFLCSIILFFTTYWVFHDPTSKLLLAPLWSPHRVLLDNLPWYRYDEKQYTYSRLNVIHGLVKIELYGLYVFIIGSLGTRIFGLIVSLVYFLKKRKIEYFSLYIFLALLISLIIPLFFIQTGKVFETIQFTWYFLFFSSLFASYGIYKIFNFNFNKIFKLALILVIIILTLPSAYEKINGYLFIIEPQLLSHNYYEAAKFLKSQGNYGSTLLEIPSNVGAGAYDDVKSWYRIVSSPTLIALSEKRGYLANERIAFRGIDERPRIEFIASIIKYEKEENYFRYQLEIESQLKENNISYIFSPYPLSRLEKTNIIQKIYQNREATIYKVSL